MKGPRYIVLALGAALAWSCSAPSERPGTGPTRGPVQVVLLALEGARADHLGSYGAAEGRTPSLDRLAAEGVRFEWAFAQSPEPSASLASLITGLYATSHGLVEAADRLVEEALTLPEILREAGFETALFQEAGRDVEEAGLGQGFDTVDVGAGAFDRGLEWLGPRSEESFLLVLGPAALGDGLAGADQVSQRYADRLTAADEAVDRLLRRLEASGTGETAIVAVVSLVGLELGEHGAVGEPTIYAPVTRVPLLLHAPDLPGGRVVDQNVELLDLMPTLLELSGEEVPREVQGGSLLPLVAGSGRPPYVAFGESSSADDGAFAALGGYRLVERAEGAELYDVVADPLELDDLSAADERRVAVLRDHLADWRKMVAAASLDPERRIEELDDDTLERLKSLGYIQ